MNDVLIYFLLWTAGCFSLGFAIGGIYATKKNIKQLDRMHEMYKQSLKDMEKLHEDYISRNYKCSCSGHDSSEHVPTYTA